MQQKITFKTSYLFGLFFLFIPFTKALTFNIGFPLKISELILAVLIIIYVFSISTKQKLKKIAVIDLLLVLFLIWATLSFIINILWQYDYDFKTFPFRINSIFDSLLRLIYIYISFFAFFISKHYLKKDERLSKYWITGAVLASIYAWYIFISSGLNLPYIRLFGMEEYPQSLFGFIRSGTFKEGNYFGLYLILSAVIAFYNKNNKIGVFLLFTIITTFSTISIISTLFFIMYILRKFFLRKRSLTIMFLIIFPLSLVTFSVVKETPYYKKYIYSKLIEPSNKLSYHNISKVDRVMTGRIAFKMGLDNLFFGVGPYNYGLHYDKYNDFRTYITNNNEWSISYFERKSKRAIANNVYIEVWSEYGLIGFIIFVFILILTLLKAIKNKNDIITGGVISLLISLNAFPSFIMLFIWSFLAIPFSMKNNIIKNSKDEK